MALILRNTKTGEVVALTDYTVSVVNAFYQRQGYRRLELPSWLIQEKDKVYYCPIQPVSDKIPIGFKTSIMQTPLKIELSELSAWILDQEQPAEWFAKALFLRNVATDETVTLINYVVDPVTVLCQPPVDATAVDTPQKSERYCVWRITGEPLISSDAKPTASSTVEPSASSAVEPTASSTVEPSASSAVEQSVEQSVEPSATVVRTYYCPMNVPAGMEPVGYNLPVVEAEVPSKVQVGGKHPIPYKKERKLPVVRVTERVSWVLAQAQPNEWFKVKLFEFYPFGSRRMVALKDYSYYPSIADCGEGTLNLVWRIKDNVTGHTFITLRNEKMDKSSVSPHPSDALNTDDSYIVWTK